MSAIWCRIWKKNIAVPSVCWLCSSICSFNTIKKYIFQLYFSTLFCPNKAFLCCNENFKWNTGNHLQYDFHVPGEQTAGGVGEVRLDGGGQTTGGDLKVYLTVVCLQVDNHSEIPQSRHSITRLHTSPQIQAHLCSVVPTATQVFSDFCYSGNPYTYYCRENKDMF